MKTQHSNSVKLAFFDVDGTLSAPRYPHENGRMDIGFTEDGWLAYCEKTGPHGYDFCRPLPPVRAFAEELHRAGTRLFVLSSCFHPNEHAAKTGFIQTHYPDLFEDFFYVIHDGEKVPLMEESGPRCRRAALFLYACRGYLQYPAEGVCGRHHCRPRRQYCGREPAGYAVKDSLR